jgi:hypothetical protein
MHNDGVMGRLLKKEIWTKRKQQLRKPQFILLAVAVIGLAVIGIASSYAFMPALKQHLESASELWILKAQKAELDRKPLPEPYNPETAAPWLRKVPVREDHSALIKTLLDLESSSGAEIIKISFHKEAPEVDELTQLMQSIRNPEQNGAGTQEEKPEVTEQGFVVEPLIIEAEGTYKEIREFWSGLHKLERLAMIKEWSLSALGDSRVAFKATMSVFTAPDFSEVLPEPKPVIAPSPPANRNDPTIPDDLFKDMLQLSNN